ncbi:hypothetical protein DFP73DRAFT_359800 [Morchella snyderi]|nr:hypothetical protein DFP73DRAFT_359800 [Morchella snyderi]
MFYSHCIPVYLSLGTAAGSLYLCLYYRVQLVHCTVFHCVSLPVRWTVNYVYKASLIFHPPCSLGFLVLRRVTHAGRLQD